MLYMKPIFWKPKMLVCTLRGERGGGLKKCTVCTLMKMLTFLDGPLYNTSNETFLLKFRIFWSLKFLNSHEICGYINFWGV